MNIEWPPPPALLKRGEHPPSLISRIDIFVPYFPLPSPPSFMLLKPQSAASKVCCGSNNCLSNFPAVMTAGGFFQLILLLFLFFCFVFFFFTSLCFFFFFSPSPVMKRLHRTMFLAVICLARIPLSTCLTFTARRAQRARSAAARGPLLKRGGVKKKTH